MQKEVQIWYPCTFVIRHVSHRLSNTSGEEKRQTETISRKSVDLSEVFGDPGGIALGGVTGFRKKSSWVDKDQLVKLGQTSVS